MTTRSGSRIYRGSPRDPLAPGACPHCYSVVGITAASRRRAHRDPATGVKCTGSGVPVGDGASVLLEDLPPVVVPPRSTRATTSEQGLSLDPSGQGLPYAGGSDRVTACGRVVCPHCGRHMALNMDGTIRRHRVRHQDPLAPYCEASA